MGQPIQPGDLQFVTREYYLNGGPNTAKGSTLTFEELDTTLIYLSNSIATGGTSFVGLTTASVNLNTINFSKSDGTDFNITVNTGSATTVNTGSLLLTASANLNVITFSKGDTSQFTVTIDTGSNFVSYNFTASFNNQSTWTVNHNLNYRYVIIQTFDISGNQIIPSEINLVDDTQAVATFPEPTSGTAVVTFGGATFNNPTLPAGVSNTVQYNDGGVFGGSSNFTFDGNNLTFNPDPATFFFGNYDNTAIALASLNGESDYTRTEIFNLRTITDSRISSFIQSNAIFVGETLFFGNSSTNALDLVYLYNNDWFAVDQGNNTKATQLLAITDGNNTYLREGYIVVAPAGSQTGNQLPIAGTNVKSGMPVYIKEGATTSPFLSTDIPATGIVRILGHLLYEDGSRFLMHFRPDHTWVEIV